MFTCNYGICGKCRKRVPAEHVVRDGKVFIRKSCPDCGTTEALVSSDAAMWQRKRDIWHFDPQTAAKCRMNCESCGHQHHPRMVFLNLTNRCNMNCPICIANIPGMGFEFHPPLSYFERVLEGLGKLDPRPTVQLFGGEPTVREDMFEIIDIARRNGLKVRIVTNGLRLADEEFCKKVCDAKVPVLFAFDGRDPQIYERLRKNPSAYYKKLKGLENLKKFSTRKNTIMCCVARHINDKHMADLIDFCHQSRSFISHLHLIPLTETWGEGEFETDVSTTLEDVEQIVDDALPGETVEFLPAGLAHQVRTALSFFGSPQLTFGGVHPNCESATILLSDGERYHSLGYFLKRPLTEVVDEAISRAQRIEGELSKLNPAVWFQRWRGRYIVVKTFAGLLLGALRFERVVKGNRYLAALRIAVGLLVGKRLKDVLRRHSRITHSLGMVVLPFEEYHSIDGERLYTCSAAFAFEDPDTGQLGLIPVCAYSLYRDELERKIAQKYAAGSLAVSR